MKDYTSKMLSGDHVEKAFWLCWNHHKEDGLPATVQFNDVRIIMFEDSE